MAILEDHTELFRYFTLPAVDTTRTRQRRTMHKSLIEQAIAEAGKRVGISKEGNCGAPFLCYMPLFGFGNKKVEDL